MIEVDDWSAGKFEGFPCPYKLTQANKMTATNIICFIIVVFRCLSVIFLIQFLKFAGNLVRRPPQHKALQDGLPNQSGIPCHQPEVFPA